jgi:hypothetical protein
MPEALAMGFWAAIGFYTLIGVVIASVLSFAGLSRLDPNAAAAPFHVRLLWIPGMIALWPLLLRRAFGAPPPEDRG